MVVGAPIPVFKDEFILLFFFMNLSSLLVASYIIEQYIAMLKNDIMPKTHYLLIKLFFTSPKELQKALSLM